MDNWIFFTTKDNDDIGHWGDIENRDTVDIETVDYIITDKELNILDSEDETEIYIEKGEVFSVVTYGYLPGSRVIRNSTKEAWTIGIGWNEYPEDLQEFLNEIEW
jgi:hypothetical protein